MYRLEITDPAGNALLSAMLLGESGSYRSPSWLKDKARSNVLKWRVVAFNNLGTQIEATN